VIYAAYTSLLVAELEWAPEDIEAERRDYLQSKGDEGTFYPSRWDDLDSADPNDGPQFQPSAFYPSRWDDLDSADPNDGPQFQPSAKEISTAPRTMTAVIDMLLLAVIVWVIFM
jgi:hypothetical protein